MVQHLHQQPVIIYHISFDGATFLNMSAIFVGEREGAV